MTKSLIIYGPQGCGKTRNGEYLASFFGLQRVVEMDELHGQVTAKEGTLFLTCNYPTPKKMEGMEVMLFSDAMAQMRAADKARKKIHPVEKFAADRWKNIHE